MITVHNSEKMDPVQMMMVQEDMERKYPGKDYTMTPGNNCIWVYWGSTVPMNLYYIFDGTRIADIQCD